MKEKLYEIIERDKEELFDLLGSLIRINSENYGDYGNEIECAEYIKKYCEDLGYGAEVYSPLEIPGFTEHPDYLEGRKLEGRRNCTMTVPGTKHDKKLMLAAHLDTVEIGDLSKWEFDPLSGEHKDGKILGRGACDDKYGIATTLFLVKKMKELGIELDYDLVFTAYCDEEHGGSNGALAAALKTPCDDCVNLDAGAYDICNAGVGGGGLLFTVTSKEPVDTCEHVMKAMRVVEKHMEGFIQNRRSELQVDPVFAGTIVARNAYRIMSYAVGGGGRSGGVNMDIGTFKVTYYTNKSREQIQAELDAAKAAADIELEAMGMNPLQITRTTRYFHYVRTPDENPVIDLLKQAGAEQGKELKATGICLSDYPMFALHGSPRSICFGLGRDFDMPGGAHQTNEFVESAELVKFTKIVGGLLLSYK